MNLIVEMLQVVVFLCTSSLVLGSVPQFVSQSAALCERPVLVFSDGFENNAVGWTSFGFNESGSTSSWRLATSNPFAGSYSFNVPDPPSASDMYLSSPTITLPQNAIGYSIEFYSKQVNLF